MKIEEVNMKSRTAVEHTKYWIYYHNKDYAASSNYKLHIALPIANFDTYHEQVYNALSQAVNAGTIPTFKIYNVGNSNDLAKKLGQLDGEKVTIQKNQDARIS